MPRAWKRRKLRKVVAECENWTHVGVGKYHPLHGFVRHIHPFGHAVEQCYECLDVCACDPAFGQFLDDSRPFSVRYR